MAKRGRKSKKWTQEEYDQIEALAGYGLSIGRIAPLFYIKELKTKKNRIMSKKSFERYMKDNANISDAIERGKSNSQSQMAQMAFQVAMGIREVEHNGKIVVKNVPPNPGMIQFWLKCQADWAETQNIRVEPGGADEGKPWSQIMLEFDEETYGKNKPKKRVVKKNARKKPKKRRKVPASK